MNQLPPNPTPARVCGDTLREARPAVSLLTPAPSPAGSFIILCRWCGDVKDENGYRSLTDYEGEMLATNLSVTPSHGICPVCAATMHTEARQLLQQKGTK